MNPESAKRLGPTKRTSSYRTDFDYLFIIKLEFTLSPRLSPYGLVLLPLAIVLSRSRPTRFIHRVLLLVFVNSRQINFPGDLLIHCSLFLHALQLELRWLELRVQDSIIDLQFLLLDDPLRLLDLRLDIFLNLIHQLDMLSQLDRIWVWLWYGQPNESIRGENWQVGWCFTCFDSCPDKLPDRDESLVEGGPDWT